jgi:hypothetical protein
MDERPALDAGKDDLVHGLGELFLAHDHAAARASQGLVRGGGHEVGIGYGARVLAHRDESRDVRNIGHKIRAHLVGNPPEARKVKDA